MTDAKHIPARYPMISDFTAKTITVGRKVFHRPDFVRRPEWDFDFKSEICGSPEGVRDIKLWNKFYAEMLGCKFNYRFFAVNYWIWIGSKMERRTGHMLTYEGRHWRLYDPSLVAEAHTVLPYINEAERDGLHNLIPLIITYRASPQEIRAKIGRGAWRRAANNSVTRNVLIMKAVRRCSPELREGSFIRLLDFPSGVMREIHYSVEQDEIVAARICPRKRGEEYRQTLHLVRDTRRMLLPDEFNPQWSYARMRHEHEAATRAVMQRRYSDKKFASEWSFQDGDYLATLLTSKAEIATEGSVQHHCVASYAEQAAAGRYAVFRIEGKERATVGIIGGAVDQVYGACNSPVSDECKAFTFKLAAAHAASRRKVLEAA